MNKTPRTDERDFAAMELKPSSRVVYASFARQLETELANSEKKVFAYKTALEQSESELIDARAEIERLNKNLRLLLCETHFDKCEAGLFSSKNPDDEPCLICLMGAAERGE